MISILFLQLSTVMNKAGATFSNKSPSLILLHNRHSTRIAQSASDEAMINKWKKEKALYFTPQGSNDDWYSYIPLASFLFAQVSFLSVEQISTCYVWQVLVICCSQVQMSSCDQWWNARSYFWAFRNGFLSKVERKTPGIYLYACVYSLCGVCICLVM